MPQAASRDARNTSRPQAHRPSCTRHSSRAVKLAAIALPDKVPGEGSGAETGSGHHVAHDLQPATAPASVGGGGVRGYHKVQGRVVTPRAAAQLCRRCMEDQLSADGHVLV